MAFMRRHRRRISRLRRLVDLGLLVILVAAAGIVHQQSLSTGRVAFEKQRLQEVARFLEDLARAEREARELALVDEDQDGRGEHLFLSELIGSRPCRGRAAPEVHLRAAFDGEHGFAEVAGYYITVYLPGEGAEGAVLDPALIALVPPYLPKPDAAEESFVAYAWPRQDAALGNHFLPALAVTERGLIYWALPASTPYVGRRRPLPLACFAAGKTLGDLPGRQGQDGLTWLSVEESQPWYDPNVLP